MQLSSDAALLQHHRDKHPTEKPPEILKKRGNIGESRSSRRGLRRHKSHTKLYLALAVILVASGAGIYGLYGVLTNTGGPYGAFPFPCTSGNLVEHVHPYLRIVINGQNVTIPADVGIVNGGACLEPVHTHDASGILHIEPTSNQQITLSNFFQIWKSTYGNVTIGGAKHPIVFNSTDIFGFKADATHSLSFTVSGNPSSQWGSLVLNQFVNCSDPTPMPACTIAIVYKASG